MENWTHLHDKNPLPTAAQRAQGARNLDRLRLELLGTTEDDQFLFLNPAVMVRKDSNAAGIYLRRSNTADGEDVRLPNGFTSVDPSPLTDATGVPYVRNEVSNYFKAYIVANPYVNFGEFDTLGAYIGAREFVPQEAEQEAVAPVLVAATYEVNQAPDERVTVQHEEPLEQQQAQEVSSTTKPSWDPFTTDFFEDDDEEIFRLEQERLEENTLSQASEGVTDADGDVEMIDFVEPDVEVEMDYYHEPEPEVVPEETQIHDLLRFNWYQAHLRAREAGCVRPYTATTPAEANYLIGARTGPTVELCMYSRSAEDGQFSIFKSIAAHPNGVEIMGVVTHDSMRRFVLLLNGAGHLRECFHVFEAYNAWPVNPQGEPLTGYKVPWVPTSMVKQVIPNFAFRLCYPKGTRGFNKKEPLDWDLYRRSSKIRNFSKMREIWTLEADLVVEESLGEDNLECWKSGEDRRRFPKTQFGAIGVTPADGPEPVLVSKTEKVRFEKMPIREFGYSDEVITPTKYQFGDFPLLQETKLVVDLEVEADAEADDESEIGEELLVEESIIEDSFIVDDDKWLAHAEEDITEYLAQAACDSSPFQDIPDKEVRPLDVQDSMMEAPFAVTKGLNPEFLAVGTSWMVMDPFSFFTMAGVGLLAWASREVMRKI